VSRSAKAADFVERKAKMLRKGQRIASNRSADTAQHQSFRKKHDGGHWKIAEVVSDGMTKLPRLQ